MQYHIGPLCNLSERPERADYDPEFSMGDHMFRDLALSRDSMTEYHKRLGPERAAEQRLTTMVLQQSFWPFSSRATHNAIIPTSVCLLLISLTDVVPSPVPTDAGRARCFRSILQ